jgi:hypothetical protein
MVDYLTGVTFGPWLARTIISLCLLIIVVAGAWWIVLRPNGMITTISLLLIWLVAVAVWIFFLPVLVQ